MYKDRFKGVGSFEDDLYTGMPKDSSKFLTEARNIRTGMKTFFLTCRSVSGFLMGVAGFFSVSLIFQSGYLFLRKMLWR